MKRAENFQGLEISYGKILLVYFMRPLAPLSIGFLKAPDLVALGQFAPALPTGRPCSLGMFLVK